ALALQGDRLQARRGQTDGRHRPPRPAAPPDLGAGREAPAGDQGGRLAGGDYVGDRPAGPADRAGRAVRPAGRARLLDCARDGKTLLVVQKHNKKDRLGLVAATGGKDVRELVVLNRWIDRRAGRFSPDGTKVLYTDADPEDEAAMKKGMS